MRGDYSVEKWAREYVESTSLQNKCAPPPVPTYWDAKTSSPTLQLGRPPQLIVTRQQPQRTKSSELRKKRVRAALIHKFWHHELQAAELMAWAIIHFGDTPLTFKKGLVAILHDEVRHMSLYEGHLINMGFQVGDFPVRDWLWERVKTCPTALSFVAVMGMGFEGANLEHSARFAARFRAVGDEEGARIHDIIGREEIAHVRFATSWFRTWTGSVDFEEWRQQLPQDLNPAQLKGTPFRALERERAEMPIDFLDSLSSWQR